jgi:hypothetical protein
MRVACVVSCRERVPIEHALLGLVVEKKVVGVDHRHHRVQPHCIATMKMKMTMAMSVVDAHTAKTRRVVVGGGANEPMSVRTLPRPMSNVEMPSATGRGSATPEPSMMRYS